MRQTHYLLLELIAHQLVFHRSVIISGCFGALYTKDTQECIVERLQMKKGND